MKKEKEIKTYICPFCKKKREIHDRTEINYRGEWHHGCQDCFMKSIDHLEDFNEKDYKFLNSKGGVKYA